MPQPQTVDFEVLSASVVEMVKLQLTAITVSKNGMMSLRQLFHNIKRHSTAGAELEFSDFIAILESNRDSFENVDGALGADVNYISIKKE